MKCFVNWLSWLTQIKGLAIIVHQLNHILLYCDVLFSHFYAFSVSYWNIYIVILFIVEVIVLYLYTAANKWNVHLECIVFFTAC